MTTIAVRDGFMASDSRSTTNKWIDADSEKKLYRLHDGAVMGMSGSFNNGVLLYQAVQRLSKEKKRVLPNQLFKGVNALLLDTEWRLFYYEPACWLRLKPKYYAIGSGAPYAMAAMHQGATASEAVDVAKKMDIYSGGRTQRMKV